MRRSSTLGWAGAFTRAIGSSPTDGAPAATSTTWSASTSRRASIRSYKAGQRGRPPITALIERWWGRTPDANVAVATGPEFDLLVLDVDGPEGERTLVNLERRLRCRRSTHNNGPEAAAVDGRRSFVIPKGARSGTALVSRVLHSIHAVLAVSP